MAMDPDLVGQLTAASARGVQSIAGFFEQHGALLISTAAYDMRLLNGFLASQLFNLDVVQAKTAYDTPRESGGQAPAGGSPGATK